VFKKESRDAVSIKLCSSLQANRHIAMFCYSLFIHTSNTGQSTNFLSKHSLIIIISRALFIKFITCPYLNETQLSDVELN